MKESRKNLMKLVESQFNLLTPFLRAVMGHGHVLIFFVKKKKQKKTRTPPISCSVFLPTVTDLAGDSTSICGMKNNNIYEKPSNESYPTEHLTIFGASKSVDRRF